MRHFSLSVISLSPVRASDVNYLKHAAPIASFSNTGTAMFVNTVQTAFSHKKDGDSGLVNPLTRHGDRCHIARIIKKSIKDIAETRIQSRI